jgi:hypothetical protein
MMNIYKGSIPSIKNVDINCTFTGSLHEMRVKHHNPNPNPQLSAKCA